MSVGRVESLTWPLIYVGMFLVALGIALRRGDAPFGWVVASIGALGIVAGAVLVYLRSRMRSDDV